MEFKTLFPEFESFDKGHLKVDDIHEVYYEQSGNPNGAPVVFVHGGPGCGCGDKSKRFLDPSFYRIITIDQRGCGKSKPFLELKDNNTQNLAKDMEKIREHLKIDKWLVYGGSWGTTLSLYYAENYPQSVVGLILRGIFLGRDEDVKWLYQGGAGMFFPEAFEIFKSPFNEEERKECHYFVNNCFFEENYILNNVDKIKDIPTIIVHGRYDVDCRPVGAYLLHEKLNNSKLIFPISGHTSFDPAMTHELILAQEEFKKLF